MTRGERTVSLRAEVDRAARLPDAADIDTALSVTESDLSPAVDEALAWATREGVTNLLRHSHDRNCRISATRRNGDATNVARGYLLTGAGLEKLA